MRSTDGDLFKDKIEVSLDGRQIFYLFFGGAVIASLVFVLGVMVGKRLESRTHVADSAQTSAVLDPLAALDQLGSDERAQELAFPKQLIKSAPAPAPAPPPRPSPASGGGSETAAPKPAPKPAAVDEPEVPEIVKVEELEPEPEVKPAPAPKPAAKPKAKFTLQLSSFQDRTEAEAFHAKLTSAGYEPYITEANVPDKGVWYRVRLGRYPSHEDALDAKADFEKRQKIIAYVTRLK
jgi:cell division protein FtsN